jgi:hypothetical protein
MLNANTVTHSQMFGFDVVFRNIGDLSSHFLLAPSFKPTDFKVSGDESQHSNIYHKICNLTNHPAILSMHQPRQQLFDRKITDVHFGDI